MPIPTNNPNLPDDRDGKDPDPPKNPIRYFWNNLRRGSEKKSKSCAPPTTTIPTKESTKTAVPTALLTSFVPPSLQNTPSDLETLPANRPKPTSSHANGLPASETHALHDVENRVSGGLLTSSSVLGVRTIGNEATVSGTNAAENYTPFNRWLEDAGPWSPFSMSDIESLDEAARFQDQESGDGELDL